MYIDLSESTSSGSLEISEGVVVDYDIKGNIVGIDIDNANTKLFMKQYSKFSFEKEILTI